MRTFEENLTLDRARELLRLIVDYVEASGSDSTDNASHLLEIGFCREELLDLGYSQEVVDDIVD